MGRYFLLWSQELIRFQKQSELIGCKPYEFQMAMEEALLVENGFTEKLIADINIAAGNTTFDESFQLRGVEEATCSTHDLDCHYANQNVFGKKKTTRPCEDCGMGLPFKMTKKNKNAIPGGQFLCKTCAMVFILFFVIVSLLFESLALALLKDEIQKREILLSNINDGVLKELVLLEQQVEIRRSRTLLWLY